MFTGVIEGVGPRYCPSIEDKIHRFAGKASHQIFLEPEGLTSNEIYPNGISTSLPFDVQLELVHSIRGFEHAHILRPGYAIEYDYFDPRDLRARSRPRPSAGCSSPARSTARPATKRPRRRACSPASTPACERASAAGWCPRRDEAYLGVLVDDLITRGVSEPYRMFTSRAEYRLKLREDNADLRLTEAGRTLGLVDDARWDAFNRKRDAIAARERERLEIDVCERWLPAKSASSLTSFLRRPEVTYRMRLPGANSRWPIRSGRAGRDSGEVRGLHRAPARRGRAARGGRVARPAARTSTTRGARAVDRSAAEAEPPSARNHRPGGAHLGHDAGRDFAAAGAPEAGLLDRSTKRRHDAARRRSIAGSRNSRSRLPAGARRPAARLPRAAREVEPHLQPDRDSRSAGRWWRTTCSTRSRCCRICRSRGTRSTCRRRHRRGLAGHSARDRAARVAHDAARSESEEGRVPAPGRDRARACATSKCTKARVEAWQPAAALRRRDLARFRRARATSSRHAATCVAPGGVLAAMKGVYPAESSRSAAVAERHCAARAAARRRAPPRAVRVGAA